MLLNLNLSLMVTEAATSTFERLELDCGVTLAPVEVAYETYGTLNAEKSNAILVLHAFSGDAHAAGEGGWWSKMIGPGQGVRYRSAFRDLLEYSGRLQGDDGAFFDQSGDGRAVGDVVSGGDGRRHGAAAEDADRFFWDQETAGGGGRIDGRDAGARMGGGVSR